ncbi:MAG TPA: molybdopterin-binding protein, partial [Pirellulales bacterium]|nr:molybdopterin-binding protein [Pirellulales bacterium]
MTLHSIPSAEGGSAAESSVPSPQSPVFAEIISIGDELTSGQRLDTNSQWLSSRLGELGVRVLYHTTVADDLEANVRVFREAIMRADIVVATGGLGPTADDLTRDAIAAAFQRQLVLDAAALEHIERLFARRQRPMPPRNRVQAMFPEGSRVIPNPEGSAPGIDIIVPRQFNPHGPREDSLQERGNASTECRLVALPGVPAEMKQMWQESVAPAIRAMLPSPRAICFRRIKCFGVGESDLEAMLPDLIRRGREPQVGITVSGATITLRVAAIGESPEACRAAMEPTVATIYECLGNLIFGEEADELQDAVIRLLAKHGQTLALAEWGTDGLIANWLSEAASASQSSDHFLLSEGERRPAVNFSNGGEGEGVTFVGGFIVSSSAARENLLEAIGQSVAADAPLDEPVAALAAAARHRLASDYALATGPLPNYDPAAPTPPRFHFALATPTGVLSRSAPYAGPADILKLRAAKQALNLVRLQILDR